MRAKEIWILDCIETDIKDNNESSARYFVKEHDDYIFSKKRSKEFDQKFFKLNDQLGWESCTSEDIDYYEQVNKCSDDPEVRGL